MWHRIRLLSTFQSLVSHLFEPPVHSFLGDHSWTVGEWKTWPYWRGGLSWGAMHQNTKMHSIVLFLKSWPRCVHACVRPSDLFPERIGREHEECSEMSRTFIAYD